MGNVYEICFYGGLTLAIIFLLVSVILFIALKIPKVLGELTGKAAKKNIREMKENGAVKDSIAKKEQAKYYNQGSGKITVREGVSAAKRKENRDDTTDLLKKGTKKPRDEATDILDRTDDFEKPDESTTDVLSVKNVRVYKDADEEATDVLAANRNTTGADTGGDDVTDVLAGDDATDVLAGDDVTDVLTGDDATDVLAGDDVTDVLTGDDATDVLAGDDATDVLTGDDATDVLTADNDETTVLSAGLSKDRLTAKYKVEFNVVIVNTQESL